MLLLYLFIYWVFYDVLMNFDLSLWEETELGLAETHDHPQVHFGSQFSLSESLASKEKNLSKYRKVWKSPTFGALMPLHID